MPFDFGTLLNAYDAETECWLARACVTGRRTDLGSKTSIGLASAGCRGIQQGRRAMPNSAIMMIAGVSFVFGVFGFTLYWADHYSRSAAEETKALPKRRPF